VAATITIGQAWLKRKADLAYDNKAYRVFLVDNSVAALDAEDTASAWLAEELPSSNGYAAVTGTITSGTGAWNATNDRYEFPAIVAVFECDSGSFEYDTVVLRIGTETAIVGILVEDPAITLLAGQAKSYRIVLGSDD
jgi:hypothetical protein